MATPHPIPPSAERPRERAFAVALLAAARPEQWTKNLVVFAPVVFALRATDPSSATRAALTAVAFCAVSSASYLANDVADRERDRHHPAKRWRPIASGEISPRAALAVSASLGAAGLALAGSLGVTVLACTGAYVAVQALYSARLKQVPLLDVFAIASGFILRVIAGAEAIAVPVSHWLYLCTLLLALFLALEKRRAELVLLDTGAGAHRDALGLYSVALVDQLATIVCACTVLAYALYTVAPETIEKFHGDRLKYTVPFVLFGIFRYLLLVHRHGQGGQPERVLLRDRTLQLDIAGWVLVVAWALYARH